MIKIDFGEIGADVVGVAGIDILPGDFHAVDFVGVIKVAEEGLLEFFWGGAGNNAGDVHIGVAGAGEAEIDYADDVVVFV